MIFNRVISKIGIMVQSYFSGYSKADNHNYTSSENLDYSSTYSTRFYPQSGRLQQRVRNNTFLTCEKEYTYTQTTSKNFDRFNNSLHFDAFIKNKYYLKNKTYRSLLIKKIFNFSWLY